MKKYLGGAKLLCDGKTTKFKSPFLITFTAFDKLWVLDTAKVSNERLVFVPAKHGGYMGGGNFLKRWRTRTDVPKPNGKYEKWTQARTAEHLGVSQTYITKIEKGEKEFPPKFMAKLPRFLS